MSHIQIVALYTGINVLLVAVLGILVVVGRAKHKINMGDAGNFDMMLRIRRHGNAIEYIPAGLIALLLLLQLGATTTILHTVGGLLTVGRILHAIGLSLGKDGPNPFRFVGTIATWLSLLIGGSVLLRLAL